MARGAPEQLRDVGPIAHQTVGFGELAKGGDAGQPLLDRKFSDRLSVGKGRAVARDEDRVRAVALSTSIRIAALTAPIPAMNSRRLNRSPRVNTNAMRLWGRRHVPGGALRSLNAAGRRSRFGVKHIAVVHPKVDRQRSRHGSAVDGNNHLGRS